MVKHNHVTLLLDTIPWRLRVCNNRGASHHLSTTLMPAPSNDALPSIVHSTSTRLPCPNWMGLPPGGRRAGCQ